MRYRLPSSVQVPSGLRGEMKLIIEDDEGHKTTVPFVRDEITVGREEGNTIRLTERNVSRRHGRFYKQAGQIFVEDLRSFNGIKVNGDRIDGAVQLNAGDLVQIGDFDLAVQGDAAQQVTQNGLSGRATQQITQNGLNGLNGRASQATEQMPALEVDTVNMPAPEEIERDPSKPAAPVANREATSVIRVPLAAPRPSEPAAAEGVEIPAEEAQRLVIESTELAGREFACIRSVLTIGRGDECDIVVNHRSLSRAHCRLERGPSGAWKVIDLGSSNRVQINGEEYAESALRPGDVITLGHVKLRFVAAGEDYAAGGSRRSRAPLFAGAALGVAVLGGGIFFLVTHGKKPVPPQPVEQVASNAKPPTEQAAPAKPAAAEPAKPAAAEPAKPAVAEAEPAKAAKPPEPAKAALAPVPDDEVKAPPPDAEARKLAAAEVAARKKLQARDPSAALAGLHAVRSLAVGDAQYEALVKQVEAEKMNQALVEDTRHGTPTADNLRALADIPETSVFYADAQRLLAKHEKQAKVTAKAHEKKVEKTKSAAASPAAPAGGEDKATRATALRKEGTDRMRSGDNEGALPILQKAVELDGNSAANLRAVAGCLARLSRFTEAAVYYRKFLEVAPNDPAAPTIRTALKNYEQGK